MGSGSAVREKRSRGCGRFRKKAVGSLLVSRLPASSIGAVALALIPRVGEEQDCRSRWTGALGDLPGCGLASMCAHHCPFYASGMPRRVG